MWSAPGPAGEGVVARAAVELVVVSEAAQAVVAGCAVDGVRAVAAVDPFHPHTPHDQIVTTFGVDHTKRTAVIEIGYANHVVTNVSAASDNRSQAEPSQPFPQPVAALSGAVGWCFDNDGASGCIVPSPPLAVPKRRGVNQQPPTHSYPYPPDTSR